MKLNKKGVTLVELIVSFALIAVSVIYFFQTLYTVKKIYTKVRTETKEIVDKNYVIRLLDKYIDNNAYQFSLINYNNFIDTYGISDICDQIVKSEQTAYYKYDCRKSGNTKFSLIKSKNVSVSSVGEKAACDASGCWPSKGFLNLDFGGFNSITQKRGILVFQSVRRGANTSYEINLPSVSANVQVNYSVATDGCGITNNTIVTFLDNSNNVINTCSETTNLTTWQNRSCIGSNVKKININVKHGDEAVHCTAYTSIDSVSY